MFMIYSFKNAKKICNGDESFSKLSTVSFFIVDFIAAFGFSSMIEKSKKLYYVFNVFNYAFVINFSFTICIFICISCFEFIRFRYVKLGF